MWHEVHYLIEPQAVPLIVASNLTSLTSAQKKSKANQHLLIYFPLINLKYGVFGVLVDYPIKASVMRFIAWS
jgi:hypothetical protein